MFQAAGLMGLAGLLDTKTGELARKRAALLGALLGLAQVEDPQQWVGSRENNMSGKTINMVRRVFSRRNAKTRFRVRINHTVIHSWM